MKYDFILQTREVGSDFEVLPLLVSGWDLKTALVKRDTW